MPELTLIHGRKPRRSDMIATTCALCDDLYDRPFGERRALCAPCVDKLIHKATELDCAHTRRIETE